MTDPRDETWTMVEEAVFRLFAEVVAEHGHVHVPLGDRLDELGWSEIENEYPISSWQLLFRAQARSLANTDCLDRVMLAGLRTGNDESATAVVLPRAVLADSTGSPDGDGDGDEIAFTGIVVGTPRGRLAVAVPQPDGAVGVGFTDVHRVRCDPIDTFDRSSTWTLVSGVLARDSVDTAAHWDDAVAAGRRALATELVATAEAVLELATVHLGTRTQFGHPIGSFQAPRHALAGAFAELEGACALASEAWRDGGDFAAVVAKSAAGQAHRTVGEVAMQVCGAIGLTAEHDLHRHVARGIQIDALLGSHQYLESAIAEHLLDTGEPDGALPTVVACG